MHDLIDDIFAAERVSTAIQMRGEFVDRDGERYMHISTFNADVTMESMRVNANGIFDDPNLSELRQKQST